MEIEEQVLRALLFDQIGRESPSQPISSISLASKAQSKSDQAICTDAQPCAGAGN